MQKSKKCTELTAEGKKPCNERLIMTPGKYYSLAKPHKLGMRPHQVTLTSHN